MPALIPVDNSLGIALIGTLLSSIIYGVTLLQVYIYYGENSKNDPPFLKKFVALLMVLDTAHLALLYHVVYHYTITNFGDYLALLNAEWRVSLIVQVIVGDILSCSVQFFFAFRIYRLSTNKNIWLPALVSLLSLGNFIATIGFSVMGLRATDFADAGITIPWGISEMVLELACDIAITVGMVYYLLKSRTEFSGTNRAMTMLITYTLNTGLLTTVFTITTLVLYLVNTDGLLYAPFFFILVHLYSVAFMSTLNSRKFVRDAIGKGRSGSGLGTTSGNFISLGAVQGVGSNTIGSGGHGGLDKFKASSGFYENDAS